ncbi:hypothetical protein ACJIZ3_022627 [Penstemon smallii]|uniref:Uncharacterized protein n=1 Tax=Penstemon smallii TaxID=265156 RepID=A0ABD3TN32_9LAMI
MPHNPDVYTTPYHPTGVIWYNATVSKTRQGAYHTIMEALAADPSYSVDKYIHIEAGLYEEWSLGFPRVGDTRSSIPSTPRSLGRMPPLLFLICKNPPVLVFE